MANETEVINGALGLLKAPRITSLDDGTELATLTRLRYALCRDAVLEHIPWNFATTRVALARSTITPAFDWSFQYPLPTNPWCIKVRDLDTGRTVPVPTPFPGIAGGQVEWEVGYDPIDGRVLLCNAETMKIRYTARIEDLNIWSPYSVLCLSYLLASELAMPVTGSVEKARLWREAYIAALGEATVSDGREGSPKVARAPTVLTDIRRGLTGQRIRFPL